MKASKAVTVEQVCAVVGGGTPTRNNPHYYGGEIPWITPKDMKSWELHNAQVSITQTGLDNSTARLVPSNSVLVVVRSGVLKHTVPVALNRVPVAINQDMKALLCSEHVNPDYLAHFIKARSPLILQWVRATTADNFPIDKLKRLEIPLPSLRDQQRIAGILAQTDLLRSKRRKTLAHVDDLVKSIFLDMFGDPATNARGWDDGSTLGQFTDIVSGVTKGRKLNGKPTRPVAYLAVANVQDRALDLTAIRALMRRRRRYSDTVFSEMTLC
jgi:type I restriction enzyme S subunit